MYAATRDLDGWRCAVKVHSGAPEEVERAWREAALSSSLRLPHLVRVHDALTTLDGRPALVLDLAESGSVATMARQRRILLPGEVVTIVAPILHTLAELHDRGIVHGDVSASNVLLDGAARPLLGDLGDARVVGERRREVRVTQGYVAPELIDGGSPTAAGDVYSAGALAWWLLTGAACVIGLLRDPLLSLAPSTPPELVETVEAMLRGHPGDRPTARAAADRLLASCPPRPLDLPAGPDAADSLTARLRGSAPIESERAAARRAPVASASAVDTPRRAAGRSAEVHEGRHRSTPAGTRAVRTPGRPAVMARRRPLVVVIAAVALVAGGWDLLHGWGEGGSTVTAPDATTQPSTQPSTEPSAQPSTIVAASNKAPAPAPTSPSGSSRTVPTTGSASPVEQGRAAAAFGALVRSRAQAYASADPTRLDEVYAAGSPLLTRERAAVDALRRRGVTYVGLTYDVRQVILRAAPADGSVRLRVKIDTSGYTVTAASGALSRQPAVSGSPLEATLVPDGPGWRIADLSPRAT